MKNAMGARRRISFDGIEKVPNDHGDDKGEKQPHDNGGFLPPQPIAIQR
jgi:hypothetical protein